MSNSYLNNLLAKSKFAQLAKSNQLMSLRTSKMFPTSQTIETTTGSFKHKDYGLKSSLPIKGKRARITVDEVDTIENMVAYERAPGDYSRKLKFDELNIPLVVRQNSLYQRASKNPLFFDQTAKRITEKERLSRTKFSEILNITQDSSKSVRSLIFDKLADQRSNFLKYLANNSPEKYIRIRKGDLKNVKIDDEIVAFLTELNATEDFAPVKGLGRLAQSDITRPVMKSTGGLSFKLKGKLQTTPNGVQKQGSIVPARLLRSNGDSFQIAVGGFVAQAAPGTLGNLLNFAGRDKTKHVTQQTIPVQVSSAILNASGAVQIRVEGIPFKTARSSARGNLQLPSRGQYVSEVNEDTIFDLLRGYSNTGDKEI